tara:strand:+ start:5706 stop:7775 length:2070 start_codon:yes stop_codon:yes gene_type:complete
MKFDKRQTGVIQGSDNHTLIPAAPGSGKSTTLCELVAKLLLVDKVHYSKITILMFNTKARKSFICKLMERTGLEESELPQVKTFHSLCGSLCYTLADRGFLPKYEMEESDGKISLMALQAITAVIGRKKWNEISGNDSQALDCFLQYIDLVKSNDLSPKDIFDALRLPVSVDFFVEAYEKFEDTRKKKKVRTFADLIRDPYLLLSRDERLAKRVGNQRDYVFVDEAQDMNPVQYGIFKIIAGDAAKTGLIGDNDQTIYSWRGSDPTIMSELYRETFAGVVTKGLSKTYRYGHELALASSYCINNNENRLPNVCVAQKGASHTSIDVHSTRDEGMSIANEIESKLKESGVQHKDIAILCRLYSAAAPAELALLEKGIPVCISGGRSVLNSKEANLILAILNLASGNYHAMKPKDRKWILDSMLKFPSMLVKHSDIDHLVNSVSNHNKALGYHLSRIEIQGLSKYQKSKVTDRSFAISSVEQAKAGAKAYDVIQEFAKATRLLEEIGKGSLTKKNAVESQDVFTSMLNFIKRLDTTPSKALEEFNRLIKDSKESAENNNAIVITSIYQAKGLDYDYVFIPGLSDTRFPHQMDGEFAIDHGVEEERRLFYVGITRAIKEVHLFCPYDIEVINHLKTGNPPPADYGSPKKNASRFIFELDLKRAKSIAKSLNDGETFKAKNEVERKYLDESEN